MNTIEISISSGPTYIGESTLRDEIEKIYGKKFTLDTIFIGIKFGKNMEFREENSGFVPKFIPYEYIHKLQENECFELTINSKIYNVCCKQKAEENMYEKSSFEDVMAHLIKNFKSNKNWICEGEESLIKAGI